MDAELVTAHRTREERVELARGFLEARNLGLIGASDGSRDYWSFNARMTRSLVGSDLDDLVLVGRSGGEFGGHAIHPSITDAPQNPGDVCVLVVPSKALEPTIEEAVGAGWSRFLIITGELNAAERAYLASGIPDRIRVWGPNCVGYQVTGTALSCMATDTRYRPSEVRGKIAILGQSGGAIGSMSSLAEQAGLTISHSLSTGEEADLGVEDLLSYFAERRTTDGIIAFVEEARRPNEFAAAVEECVAANIPIVTIKVGRSARAQAVAQDHTGALVGDWDEFAAAITSRGGMISSSMRDAANAAAIAINNGGKPIGRRTAVFTTSGGSGALASDVMEQTQLEFASMRDSIAGLEEITARKVTLNPYDSATGGGTPKTLPRYLELIEKDASVDSMLMLHGGNVYHELVTEQLTSDTCSKPMVMVSAGLDDVSHTTLLDHRILVAQDLSDALRWMDLASAGSTDALPTSPHNENEDASEDSSWLTYHEGTTMLADLGVGRPRTVWVDDPSAGSGEAASLSFPVVVKGGNLRGHKAKHGGVKVGVADADELAHTVSDMGQRFSSLVVEEFAPRGADLLLTVTRGEQDGLIVIGLGGAHADAFGRQVVLSARSTEAQIASSLRESPLATYVGSAGADAELGVKAVASAARTLVEATVARGLKSIEINPLVVTSEACVACDVKARRAENGVTV